MRAALLLPIAAAAGCSGPSSDPAPQPSAPSVALPAAGAADAVRTAKPGTAPVPGASPTAAPPPPAASPTP